MIIQADFSTAQTGVGYRFYGGNGWTSARITAGIVSPIPALPGLYEAEAIVPAGTAGVYWDCDGNLNLHEDLRESLSIEGVRVKIDSIVSNNTLSFVVNTENLPGLISPLDLIRIRVLWGQDLIFSFLDPGTGNFKVIFKTQVDDPEPVFKVAVSHTSGTDLNLTVIGGDMRKYFIPGIYFFSLLKLGTNGAGYVEMANGSFTLVEGASSSEVPPSA